MKYIVALALVSLAVATAEPIPVTDGGLSTSEGTVFLPQVFEQAQTLPPRVDKFSLCPTCVSLMGQTYGNLLNIIANAGVIGGCNKLCGALNGTKTETMICDLVCSYVGIKTFINVIEHIDFDPILICETFKVCPINDGGDAKITGVSVNPPVGKTGDKFEITLNLHVANNTGTGEITIDIDPPAGMAFGDAELNEGLEAGDQSITFALKTEPNDDQPFTDGDYNVQLQVCNGQCSSAGHHAHAKVFDTTTTKFTIDNKSE